MKKTDSKIPDATYSDLMAKVKAREKVFEDGWWKHAEKAVELFNAEKENKDNPYNILYSNTEVLKPSLYSATPKPDVRGRFLENPVTPSTKLVERFLIVFTDPANPGEESFDHCMSESVSSSLVAGLGFIRLRYYAEKDFPLCLESGHYKGLIWAAGRKWHKLPWIAFRHELTRAEFFSQFGIKAEDQARLKAVDDENADEKPTRKDGALVYEVWNKSTGKILFLCEDWEDLLVKEDPNSLNLQGFYPTPGLLLMTQKPGRLIPTPLYQYYRDQAEELNRVTYRLNRVLSALRVRGAYNTLLGKTLETLLSDSNTENALVPAEQAGLMMQSGGFEKNIWLLPLEKLVEVATQLYQARMQIKQVIYEITGLSDIIRGSSVASETATAQNLKNKWGSIRLRDMQKFVAGYVRDLYRLTVDAATEVVPAEQWKAITQAPFPLQAEKDAAIQRLQQMQSMAPMAAMTGQQPPPPPPELLQAAQSPSIEELLAGIKTDANRAFVINVQSDSTVDIDTATDKAEVNEFMGAMAQLLPGLAPLAQLGPSGMNAAKEILVAVCSRFKFGLSVIEPLRAIQAPPAPQPGPTPEQEKIGKELESREKDLESKANEVKSQEEALQDLLDQLEDAKREIEVARKELAADVRVASAEQQASAAQQDAKVVALTSKIQVAAAKNGPRPAAKGGGGNSPAAPAPQGPNPSETVMMQTMANAIVEMGQALKMMAAPRMAQKDANGQWISVPIPSEETPRQQGENPLMAASSAVGEMRKTIQLLQSPRTAQKDPATGNWYSQPTPKQ